MKHITKEDLLNKLIHDDCLCKFRNKNNYSCYGKNMIYCSRLDKIRSSTEINSDLEDGKLLTNIKIGGHPIHTFLHPYKDLSNHIYLNPSIFNNENGWYTYEFNNLNNFIYCISKSDATWTADELDKMLNNYGHYVFLTKDVTSLVKAIIRTKNKELSLLAASPVEYVKTDMRIDIFKKPIRYSFEHEYRIVFKENDHKNSVCLPVDGLLSIGELYKVI